MRKNIKKLLFTLLFAVTLVTSTASSYSAATHIKETTTIPPLSFDEDLPDEPWEL